MFGNAQNIQGNIGYNQNMNIIEGNQQSNGFLQNLYNMNTQELLKGSQSESNLKASFNKFRNPLNKLYKKKEEEKKEKIKHSSVDNNFEPNKNNQQMGMNEIDFFNIDTQKELENAKTKNVNNQDLFNLSKDTNKMLFPSKIETNESNQSNNNSSYGNNKINRNVQDRNTDMFLNQNIQWKNGSNLNYNNSYYSEKKTDYENRHGNNDGIDTKLVLEQNIANNQCNNNNINGYYYFQMNGDGNNNNNVNNNF